MIKKYIAIGFIFGIVAILAGWYFTNAQVTTTDIKFYAPYVEDNGDQSVVYYFVGAEKPAQKNEILSQRQVSLEIYDLGNHKFKQVSYSAPKQLMIGGKWFSLNSATTTLNSFENTLNSKSVFVKSALALSDTRQGGTWGEYTITGGGGLWTNQSQAKVSDNAWAINLLNAGQYSHLLYGSNWGFNIPNNSTIDGVAVTSERSRPTVLTGRIKDNYVQLFLAGSPTGNTTSVGTQWPATTDATVTYGSATNKWGLSLTPSDINDTGFGVGASAIETTGTSQQRARIDQLTMTVYYTEIPVSVMSFPNRHFEYFLDMIL